MISNNERLDKVYMAKNHKELMEAYKNWACDYDNDTVCKFGYVAHIEGAKALMEVVKNKSALILDAGCGTGLVGQELKNNGYKNIDALDYSKEMLEEAGKKGVYGKLIHADLSRPLKIKTNQYDAVVCTGTFTFGHVKADAFNELVRITKPGGAICFTIREGAYEAYGYRKRMIDLESKNEWELSTMVNTDYLKNENVMCKLCTYIVREYI